MIRVYGFGNKLIHEFANDIDFCYWLSEYTKDYPSHYYNNAMKNLHEKKHKILIWSGLMAVQGEDEMTEYTSF